MEQELAGPSEAGNGAGSGAEAQRGEGLREVRGAEVRGAAEGRAETLWGLGTEGRVGGHQPGT